jgi:hypothetical protein
MQFNFSYLKFQDQRVRTQLSQVSRPTSPHSTTSSFKSKESTLNHLKFQDQRVHTRISQVSRPKSPHSTISNFKTNKSTPHSATSSSKTKESTLNHLKFQDQRVHTQRAHNKKPKFGPACKAAPRNEGMRKIKCLEWINNIAPVRPLSFTSKLLNVF